MTITYLVRPEHTPFNIRNYKHYRIAVVLDIDQIPHRTKTYHQLTEYWGRPVLGRAATPTEIKTLEMMPMERTRCHWYKYYSLDGLIEDEIEMGVSPEIINELKRIITEDYPWIPIQKQLLVHQQEDEDRNEENIPDHIKRLFNQQLTAEQRDRAFEIAEMKARQLQIF